jgi:peptide/nickel transport system ATP-binding protein
VMYLGKLCEVAPSDELYRRPAHHYTKVLLDSIPVPDPSVPVMGTAITGEPPSPVNPPTGCRFHPRCPAATDVCITTEPVIEPLGNGHFVACHHPLEFPVLLNGD